MISACPICSSAIYERASDRAMIEAPAWFFATLSSRKRKRPTFTWIGCVHAQRFDPKFPIEDHDRAATEEAWNAHARTLLAERTKNWSEEVRRRFSEAIGFVDACREVEFR